MTIASFALHFWSGCLTSRWVLCYFVAFVFRIEGGLFLSVLTTLLGRLTLSHGRLLLPSACSFPGLHLHSAACSGLVPGGELLTRVSGVTGSLRAKLSGSQTLLISNGTKRPPQSGCRCSCRNAVARVLFGGAVLEDKRAVTISQTKSPFLKQRDVSGQSRILTVCSWVFITFMSLINRAPMALIPSLVKVDSTPTCGLSLEREASSFVYPRGHTHWFECTY